MNAAMELRNYQETGKNYLLTSEKCILGDEMGLGKTCQAISALVDGEDTLPALVVVPAYLIYNWEKELKA